MFFFYLSDQLESFKLTLSPFLTFLLEQTRSLVMQRIHLVTVSPCRSVAHCEPEAWYSVFYEIPRKSAWLASPTTFHLSL